MTGIELKTPMAGAGATLQSGAYLYTALVHRHRSSSHLLKRETVANFLNLPRVTTIPRSMGRNAGYVSRTYFAGALSSQDLLRRHTLFGYLHLAKDKVDADALEKSLILGNTNDSLVGPSSVQNLRWCKYCADDELEAYGFASWKVVHQISQVRACYIHNCPLLSRCRVCGTALGAVQLFRLPGEACPKCNSSDFCGESIIVRDAYRVLIQNIATAFEKQENNFRHSLWNIQSSMFISGFPSWIDAQNALLDCLCREWELSSSKQIWDLINTPLPARGNLFESGDRYLAVRILLHHAMRVLYPEISGGQSSSEVLSSRHSGALDFASVVKQHAFNLGLGGRITDALTKPLGIKAAAAAAGLAHSTTHLAWKQVLNSMKAELGEDVVRALLPKYRRVNISTVSGRFES
jgi:hypothetical protein